MAKDSQFKAYDLHRKKQHAISSPLANITRHRLNPADWADAEAVAGKPARKVAKKRAAKTKKRATKKAVRTATDILHCWSAEIECLHCGKLGDDPNCESKCYDRFRKDHSIRHLIDVKGPSHLGYGAFTRPGVQLSKGQWLDEYLGELKPLAGDTGETSASLYRCEIPGICAVDAEQAGNWTRFINSHCRPNVKLWGEFVGKRHVILFQALRDIGPEEEIVFNYGSWYFERAGFKCVCDAYKRPHIPGGEHRAKKPVRCSKAG
ncbi:hypothetical protein LTR36_007772 [Oleoguttula mirabilis]|uniref:SET domain-containing protein n=1 Tax=Oleoguttula mirabilis TaxID=1507867 RepID=A0AAV9J944_9PEZI|nr:hypothetical protein LTR36_007772 [Oleoguttula mirabilis]